MLRYPEKAEYAQLHPGTKTAIDPAEDNRKKQCKPNETLVKDTILLRGGARCIARLFGCLWGADRSVLPLRLFRTCSTHSEGLVRIPAVNRLGVQYR